MNMFESTVLEGKPTNYEDNKEVNFLAEIRMRLCNRPKI